ncbi:Cache 3/Cache 2 fusion domain-containing protein, partial [Devosia sp.]|uniref:Cache 3/Cache 2 fusion domain-containing protein n=1 Tax=Devosia sp. TaxID=1871048 RepID=UPI002FC6F2B8
MGSLLGNIRLTFAIAAMAVCSIAIAIGAVLLGLFISLSGTASSDAEHEVASATRITAEILRVNLPSLEIVPDEAGNIAALTMRSMPRFRSHDVIDAIARVAGQQAAIYVYDSEVGPDFNVGTSSLLKADGERLLDTPILAGTPLFDSMMANSQTRAEEVINGVEYFTLYQPVAMADGTVIGALLVAVDRAPIEAVVGKNLTMLIAVGGAALLVIGIMALLLS